MAWGRKSRESKPVESSALPPGVEEPEPELAIEVEEAEVPSTSSSKSMTFVGDGMEIKGTVATASSLIVAGFIEGDVNSAGHVEVRREAVIQGTVAAQTLTVHGAVEGNVTASGRLHIASTGKVDGDVQVAALQVDEGGSLLGRCKM
jgi:cytoskeletal protein CcmA (bactofilin family)